MEEEQTKLCPNCKREIPSSNFTIHSVHCARNIRMCPVCKEPVPVSDLEKHHDELHKQLPCKQCGDSVCGTDLEDHIRDSCAQTIKSCRYCELELPRRDLPPHESYCGVRTEQCPDCKEWVMIKYRQLHLDSNHGFIRLDDDPPPIIKPLSRPFTSKSIVSPTNGAVRVSIFDNYVKNINPSRNNTGNSSESNGPVPGGSGMKAPSKRKNDQPQINTNVAITNKVAKDLCISRGAVKKRPAPPPPRAARDMPYYSALDRQEQEQIQREQQNAANLAAGLPPVLNAAEKLERLRKLDRLLNVENNNVDYKNRNHERARNHAASGTVPDTQPLATHASVPTAFDVVPDTFNVPGPSANNASVSTHNVTKQANITPTTAFNLEKQLNVPKKQNVPNNFDKSRVLKTLNTNNIQSPNGSEYNVSKTTNTNVLNAASTSANVPGTSRNVSATTSNAPLTTKNTNLPGNDVLEMESRRKQFKDLKPMSPEEFVERFKRIRMAEEHNTVKSDDRMSEIKSSLRELRRELNEVTAPYNTPPPNNVNIDPVPQSPPDDIRLPCEFCGAPVPMDQLVLHQTGCRPDLARLGRVPLRSASPPRDVPVIPCEFCTESLPVYLINDHQERCGREANLLYPD